MVSAAAAMSSSCSPSVRGEVVAGPGGDDAEWDAGARELLQGEVDGAVPARDDDRVGAEPQRRAEQIAGLGGAAAADDRGADAVRSQPLGGLRCGARVRAGACGGIGEECDVHAPSSPARSGGDECGGRDQHAGIHDPARIERHLHSSKDIDAEGADLAFEVRRGGRGPPRGGG